VRPERYLRGVLIKYAFSNRDDIKIDRGRQGGVAVRLQSGNSRRDRREGLEDALHGYDCAPMPGSGKDRAGHDQHHQRVRVEARRRLSHLSRLSHSPVILPARRTVGRRPRRGRRRRARERWAHACEVPDILLQRPAPAHARAGARARGRAGARGAGGASGRRRRDTVPRRARTCQYAFPAASSVRLAAAPAASAWSARAHAARLSRPRSSGPSTSTACRRGCHSRGGPFRAPPSVPRRAVSGSAKGAMPLRGGPVAVRAGGRGGPRGAPEQPRPGVGRGVSD